MPNETDTTWVVDTDLAAVLTPTATSTHNAAVPAQALVWSAPVNPVR
jgi:hypothetical protein